MGLIEVGIDSDSGGTDRRKVDWLGVVQSIRAKDDSGREVLVEIHNNEITSVTFNAEEDDPDDHMIVMFENKWSLANLCKHIHETISGPVPEVESDSGPVAPITKPIYRLSRVINHNDLKLYEYLDITNPTAPRYYKAAQ